MMINILAHRGYWNTEIERNSLLALCTALEKGFGFESDVRDYNGKLVISHNIADASSPEVEEIFRCLAENKDRYCFAINIKADGLKDLLMEYITRYRITNYFLFDMSVPQMVEFDEMGLRYFTRQSEVEPTPCMYDRAAGVWIDGFWGTSWITEELLKGHIENGKDVCIVSPDLHGRKDYQIFWEQLKNYRIDLSTKVMLCTDHPDEARTFFAKTNGGAT